MTLITDHVLLYGVNSNGQVVPLLLAADGSLASSGGGVTDHGLLTGLADNDHSQYALAASLAPVASAGTYASLTGKPNITPQILLEYAPATDLISNGALTVANGFVDVHTNQSFTPVSAASLIGIFTSGFIRGGATVADSRSQVQMVIDSAGTPITRTVAATDSPITTVSRVNYLVGCGAQFFSGLSAAAHTVKLQIKAIDNTMEAYCRPGTTPPEFLRIVVVEFP